MGGVQTRARWILRLVALDKVGEICAVPRASAIHLFVLHSRFVDGCHFVAFAAVAARQLRRLLDTEKVMFKTDRDGHIGSLVSLDGQPAATGADWSYAVDITAEQDVVAPAGESPPRTVQYNVVLERLVLGGAPREAVKMGILLAVALSFTFWHLVPRMRGRLFREIARANLKS